MEPQEFVIRITGPGLDITSTPGNLKDLDLVYTMLAHIASRLDESEITIGRRAMQRVREADQRIVDNERAYVEARKPLL